MRAPDRAPSPRSAPRVRAAAPAERETDRATRVAALLAVLAALAALPASELLPAGPAAVAALLALTAAWLAGRDAVVARSPAWRGLYAAGAVATVLGLTAAAPGPAPLLPVAGEMPSGTVAGCAAGALAAVVLEFAARRGLLSAMLLCLAVLGLCAALATDNRQLVPPFVAGWPALLVAVARAGAVPGGRPAARMRRLPGPGGRRAALRWNVLPAFLAIALACGVLAVLRLGGGWAGVTDTGGGGGGGGTGTGASGRAVGQYVGTSMDLRSRGDLSDDPVLRVPAASPGLWRGGWLDRYDGLRWTASTLPQAERLGIGRAPDDRGTFLAVPGAGALREPVRGVRQDIVTPLEPWAVVVVAPGPVRRVTSPAFTASGSVAGGPGDRLYLVDDQAARPYRVRSLTPLSVGDAPRGVAPGPAAADPVDDRWTQLPGSVPARVLQLGRQLAAASPDRRAAVLAVENEIRERVRYTLDSAQPRRGQDAVDDVLFTSHEGFCEQFASAAVVLLRAAGIPARMATGFASGTRDGDGRVFRQSDGHAWVEVWFPGAGWVTSDPTAGATPATTWWERAAAAVRERAEGVPLRIVGGAVLGAVLVLAGAARAPRLLRRRLRSALEEDEAEAEPRLPAELGAAFDRFEVALAGTGLGRPPTESVATLARRLRSAPVADDADTAHALDVVQRALYAARLPDPAECLTAAEALDAAAERIVESARETAAY